MPRAQPRIQCSPLSLQVPLPATGLACSPWLQCYKALLLLTRFPVPSYWPFRNQPEPPVRSPHLRKPHPPRIHVSSCVLPGRALHGADSHLNHSFTPQTCSECLPSACGCSRAGTQREWRKGPVLREGGSKKGHQQRLGGQVCVHPELSPAQFFVFFFFFKIVFIYYKRHKERQAEGEAGSLSGAPWGIYLRIPGL